MWVVSGVVGEARYLMAERGIQEFRESALLLLSNPFTISLDTTSYLGRPFISKFLKYGFVGSLGLVVALPEVEKG